MTCDEYEHVCGTFVNKNKYHLVTQLSIILMALKERERRIVGVGRI